MNTPGNGNITADPEQLLYDVGSLVELTATAAVGWASSGWSGDSTISDW